MYNVPVLFVFFNRRDVALRSFERIRAMRPSRLYLAQDGARPDKGSAEAELVEEIRQLILSKIDWDCQLHTLFRKQNVGCSLGVKTAVDWMFQTEERGIILEDDCVVQQSFWQYMEEMLDLYADDQRIGMVAGYNEIGSSHSPYSYTFSRYKACWGWATWRRAWQNMDLDMKWRHSAEYMSVLRNMGSHIENIKYWTYRLKCIDQRFVSAWDWQWYFTLSSQNQLCIFPDVSLVSNIGFGADSTHTSAYFNEGNRESDSDLALPLRHPQYIVPNADFDCAFYHNNNDMHNRIIQLLPLRLKSFLKKYL